MVKKIKPWKGGRTVQLHTLATPETRAKLDYLQKSTGKSLGDLIEDWVNRDYEVTTQESTDDG